MNPALFEMVHPPESPASTDPREALVRTHLRGVWRFLRLLGSPPDEADDLTQETFVVAFAKGLDPRDEGGAGSFLRGTARHLFLRNRERRNRRAGLLADAAERLWTRTCAADEGDRRVAALRDCIAELGERARHIVGLFYGEGRSRAEVAAELGMQETGVKTALQRCRDTLKECLSRRIA